MDGDLRRAGTVMRCSVCEGATEASFVDSLPRQRAALVCPLMTAPKTPAPVVSSQGDNDALPQDGVHSPVVHDALTRRWRDDEALSLEESLAYVRWLETGEGDEPCPGSSG
jgi:hypothetical protein